MAILKSKEKRVFNVQDKTDLKIFNKYFKTGTWGADGCPFLLEEPYTNIPYMCKYKIVSEFLKGK